MVYKYEWKLKQSVDANVVGKEFERLEEQNGTLTAVDVLDSAKSEDSPLHELFEWDDTVAANKYRLSQASFYIRILVKTEVQEEQPKSFRAYVNINPNPQSAGTFENTVTALSKEDTRRIVLNNALKELVSFQNKYNTLIELSAVFSAIDNAVKDLGVNV